MTADSQGCQQCGRKVIQSISNRCMYCGADLPDEFHLDQEGKNRLLNEKLERFRQTEENADDIIYNMRKDFGLPQPKKSRKQQKADNAAATAAALANIANHSGEDGSSGKT